MTRLLTITVILGLLWLLGSKIVSDMESGNRAYAESRCPYGKTAPGGAYGCTCGLHGGQK